MRKNNRQNKIIVRKELNFEHNSWFDFYDYYDDNYENYWIEPDYSYLKDNELYDTFLNRKYGYKYNPYKAIDMNSIYSKEYRRNKIINEILGESIIEKPTLRDIWASKI